MYKYILIFLFLLVQSCSKPMPEYLAKEQARKDFKEKANANCSLNYLDNSKDILVATIFFKDLQSDLSKKDKEVLKNVVEIDKDCAKAMLLVGHSSKLEENELEKKAKDGFTNTAKLSFIRVKEVSEELQKNKILGKYINISFCGVSNPLVQEDDPKNANKKANLYNQRVDIVFLNTSLEDHDFDCISSIKISEK